jgi:hypothetical protein
VHAVELAQISQQVLINDFVTDDRPRVQMVKFKLGSVLVKSPLGDAALTHSTLVGQQGEEFLHGAVLEHVGLQRTRGQSFVLVRFKLVRRVLLKLRGVVIPGAEQTRSVLHGHVRL